MAGGRRNEGERGSVRRAAKTQTSGLCMDFRWYFTHDSWRGELAGARFGFIVSSFAAA